MRLRNWSRLGDDFVTKIRGFCSVSASNLTSICTAVTFVSDNWFVAYLYSQGTMFTELVRDISKTQTWSIASTKCDIKLDCFTATLYVMYCYMVSAGFRSRTLQCQGRTRTVANMNQMSSERQRYVRVASSSIVHNVTFSYQQEDTHSIANTTLHYRRPMNYQTEQAVWIYWVKTHKEVTTYTDDGKEMAGHATA